MPASSPGPRATTGLERPSRAGLSPVGLHEKRHLGQGPAASRAGRPPAGLRCKEFKVASSRLRQSSVLRLEGGPGLGDCTWRENRALTTQLEASGPSPGPCATPLLHPHPDSYLAAAYRATWLL